MADNILQYLLDLVTRLGDWSYLIIFAAAMLECAAFAGLLVPGESLVLASGFFAHQGILELDAVIAAVAVGAVAGDNIGYLLGARLGREWLLRKAPASAFGKAPGPGRRILSAAGASAVFIGRFIGFARALVPFVAGASRMSYRRFVLADALGAGLWTVAFVPSATCSEPAGRWPNNGSVGAVWCSALFSCSGPCGSGFGVAVGERRLHKRLELAQRMVPLPSDQVERSLRLVQALRLQPPETLPPPSAGLRQTAPASTRRCLVTA